MMDTVTLNIEKKIYVFPNFEWWVDKASTRINGYRPGTMICVDKAGNICVIGEDFMHARDNDLFPVTAYLLKRSCGKP